MPKQKLNDLSAGSVLPPVSFDISSEEMERYRQAVGDESPLYRAPEAPVPPAGVAALSLGALLRVLELPPGAVHASQELEFLAPVRAGSQLTCHCQIRSKFVRAGSTYVGLDISTRSAGGEVLRGRVVLVVLAQAEEVAR